MKHFYFALTTCLLFVFGGCKEDLERVNCYNIQRVKIVADKDSVGVGDEIYLHLNDNSVTAYFNWTHSSFLNSISTNPEIRINSAQKSHEGWFYLELSDPDCITHYDSIYIKVTAKPVPAPCTPVVNGVNFSSIPDIAPTRVTWAFSPSWNRRVLSVQGDYGYPDFEIYFNTYWDNREPEDGEYNVVSMSETNEYPPYTVHISSLYSGIPFYASSGKVYVSHVNNKLRVTFCDLPLSGSNGGPSFKTTASGALTAP